MNLKQLAWGLLAGMLCTHAMAVESHTPTDAEFASLPPYCKARMKQGSPEYKTWEQTLGKDFVHTHHYCFGINFINRYYRARSNSEKLFNLKNAQGNLQYMVTHAEPSYSLMPDVYLSLGVVYSLSNQTAQAIAYFNKAVELNPQQPRAYNALADYYVKTKQTAKALEIVSEGLRHNPDIRSLQRRYTELGGKLPYPAPTTPALVEIPAATSSTEKSEVPAVSVPVEQTMSTPVTEQVTSPPAIGTPKNPYCRFCAD